MPGRKSVRRKTIKRKGRKAPPRSNRKTMRRSNRKTMRRSNRKTMRRSNKRGGVGFFGRRKAAKAAARDSASTTPAQPPPAAGTSEPYVPPGIRGLRAVGRGARRLGVGALEAVSRPFNDEAAYQRKVIGLVCPDPEQLKEQHKDYVAAINEVKKIKDSSADENVKSLANLLTMMACETGHASEEEEAVDTSTNEEIMTAEAGTHSITKGDRDAARDLINEAIESGTLKPDDEEVRAAAEQGAAVGAMLRRKYPGKNDEELEDLQNDDWIKAQTTIDNATDLGVDLEPVVASLTKVIEGVLDQEKPPNRIQWLSKRNDATRADRTQQEQATKLLQLFNELKTEYNIDVTNLVESLEQETQ